MVLSSLSTIGRPSLASVAAPWKVQRTPFAPRAVEQQSNPGTTASAAVDELDLSEAALAILKAPPLAGSQQVAAVESVNESTAPLSADPADESSDLNDLQFNVAGEDTNSGLVAKDPSAFSDITLQANSEAGSEHLVEEDQAKTEAVDGEDEPLTPEEQEQVEKLELRDREVRTHEQAHIAAAGPHARGGPTYTYQEGPDGKRYAIGGEVQIDTSAVPGDPEATIRKAQVVRAAALAPAEPSSQDRAVAAAATKMQQAAQAELIQQQQSEVKDGERSGDAAESKKTSSDSMPRSEKASVTESRNGESSQLDLWA